MNKTKPDTSFPDHYFKVLGINFYPLKGIEIQGEEKKQFLFASDLL